MIYVEYMLLHMLAIFHIFFLSWKLSRLLAQNHGEWCQLQQFFRKLKEKRRKIRMAGTSSRKPLKSRLARHPSKQQQPTSASGKAEWVPPVSRLSDLTRLLWPLYSPCVLGSSPDSRSFFLCLVRVISAVADACSYSCFALLQLLGALDVQYENEHIEI